MGSDDDHERFTRLLIRHEPELLRCILVAVPNRADARDVLQDASVALWRRFADYDPARPFPHWAAGFVRMEVRRFLRKRHRRARLTERAAELLFHDEQRQSAASDERAGHLRHCFDRLPRRQRELLDGYYYQEFSVAELAVRDGRSADAVYKMLQRVRAALHRCVESRMRGAGR